MTKPLRHLTDKALMLVAKLAAKLPKNDYFSAYTITNGTTNYLTRVKFPRVFGRRVMLHKIWRADSDREMHNHPWDKAYSFILVGSYMEERIDHTADVLMMLRMNGRPRTVPRTTQHIKWFNRIFKEDFHRISEIDGPLWTLFIAYKRTADQNGVEWGFLNEETRELIPFDQYIMKTGSAKT